jgi:hypothetical protein
MKMGAKLRLKRWYQPALAERIDDASNHTNPETKKNIPA